MQTRTHPPRTAPQIDRADWASHPRFPEQVLLLGSHDGFRRISAHLIEHAGRSASPEGLEYRYRGWISAMRSHESYEEGKLYPYLARRWGVSFEAAEAGHHALHEAHAGVLSAFGRVRQAEDAEAARAELVAALEAHDRILRDHLEFEEDLVIPLLLSLTPEEFERYYYGSIRTLLRDLDARGRRAG